MSRSASPSSAARSAAITLLPVMAAVLAGFLVVGAALPVLPLHVSRDLGFGSVVVGMVAGTQFAASLLSRVWSGSYSDTKGGKRAVVTGLVTAAVAGLLYLLSSVFEGTPTLSITVLLVGRAALGGAESFIVTGGVSWGFALVDSAHAGKVIAWVGTAMFAALACGGPLGALLFASHGFVTIGAFSTVLPLFVLVLLVRANGPLPQPRPAKSDFGYVIGAVWLPGVAAALSSIGYGAILAFSSLLYAVRHWEPIWLGFTAFGIALIGVRVVCGHLPDKFGGARIAFWFVLVQSAGLIVMGLARDGATASVGAALAGLGYSLVFPGLGVEAVRGTSPEHRGLAMGLYTAFLDVAMAIGSPLLGWIADRDGLSAVFIVSGGVTLCTAAIAARLVGSERATR
ncbi:MULTISPECIES: arabinose transporter [Bradyrhizobium]|uniref:arabinose transporter n=1 Tax=Bradyrhizobium TaxID=374 RepID=UPI0004887995|nr:MULTISPECIES: arabinose transporter [Bradyrhizobium]MCS3450283.1 MFS family permease [Bradyrhizobium elkanii]MCS3558572.1 MFS family permease [Bradyrhizobium elkanii]MCW2151581.1 MFS family permease [Bradyrhizobium elkanii]MCW2358546.1 MFS family permease [Bradyrhizobium elkanii]MCW2375312.1 MFS family permease [Bradyrhizobium elkanii]